MKNVLLFLLFFCYLLATPSPISAQRVFSEDFADNLDQWTLVNGSLSYWQIQNQALYATIPQSYTLSTLVPRDEFWQDMDEYTVDFVFKAFDDNDKNFVIGMRDAANFYDFHFYGNQLYVEDIRNGVPFYSVTIPFTLQLNRDYAVHLLYSKEKIELSMDGTKIFATDIFWASPIYGGKFGLKVSAGSRAQSKAYFDQVEVRELYPQDVLFKQNDSLWGLKLYDHANLWSQQPLMSNWACALSSAAMLLRAYGFYLLPNGEIIDPWSLNQWLLTQNDGYIADGLVNWLAISRLSKILSKTSNNYLPKLEFSYFMGSEAENLVVLHDNLLNGEKGQIVATTGHFFLVSDYIAVQDNFAIKDPLYDYTLLSQREDQINSLRLFTPSFSDLSYLLFVLPKDLIFSLVDASGQKIEQLQVVTEEIVSPPEKMGENYQLVYYRKPESAHFNLVLELDNIDQALLKQAQIYLYDQSGEVQLFNLKDLLPAEQNFANLAQLLVKIDYAKAAASKVTSETVEKTAEQQKQTTLNTWATQSREDFEAGKMSFYLFYQLNLLIDSLREHLNYFFLLDKFLDFHQL